MRFQALALRGDCVGDGSGGLLLIVGRWEIGDAVRSGSEFDGDGRNHETTSPVRITTAQPITLYQRNEIPVKNKP